MTDDILAQICAETGCTGEQMRQAVGAAFEALHKIAFCDERNVTAALMESYFAFGARACYHLGGILEQARINADSDLPWSETLMRIAPAEWKQFQPLVDNWLDRRSEQRKLLDQRGGRRE